MLITDLQARIFLSALYHTAQRDKNDLISNAAAVLAARFESARSSHKLSKADVELIKYSTSIVPEQTALKDRRKSYKRRVTLA